MEVITTITVPATTPVRLTTKEHVRGDLNITSGADDIYIDRLIDAVSETVIRYCGRTFASETLQDVFYAGDWHLYQRSPGDELLQLTRWPIISIASVIEYDASGTQTTLVENTDFVQRGIYGQLLRLDSATGLPRRWWMPKIAVTYSAGYSLPAQTKTGENYTLPRSLEEVVIRIIKSRWLARNRDPMLRQQIIPNVIEQQFWIDTGRDGDLSPDEREALDRFRVPVIG